MLRTSSLSMICLIDLTGTQVTAKHLRDAVENKQTRKWSHLEPIYAEDFQGFKTLSAGKEVLAYIEFQRFFALSITKANEIGRCWKMYRARKLLRSMRRNKIGRRREEQALRIQRVVRMWICKFHFSRIHIQIVTIQAEWREYVIRKKNVKTKVFMAVSLHLLRIMQTRLSFRIWKLVAKKLTREKKVHAVTTLLSQLCRIYRHNCIFLAWREECRRTKQRRVWLRNHCAFVVQRSWKQKILRKALEGERKALEEERLKQRNILQTKIRSAKAIVIQSCARKAFCVAIYRELCEINFLKKEQSLIILQTQYRRHMCNRVLNDRKLLSRFFLNLRTFCLNCAVNKLKSHMGHQKILEEKIARVISHLLYGTERFEVHKFFHQVLLK
jgi:hypothetical protein